MCMSQLPLPLLIVAHYLLRRVYQIQPSSPGNGVESVFFLGWDFLPFIDVEYRESPGRDVSHRVGMNKCVLVCHGVASVLDH